MSTECIKELIPNKLSFSLFNGDMKAYKEALYKIFKRDLIEYELTYKGKNVDIIHEKFFEEKERSFWHIISEGDDDVSRTPISWRAETITWIKPLISEDGTCSEYKSWIKYHDRTKRNRHYIWCVAINYMVILEDRHNYYKLITAYPVQEYSIKKYENEYKRCCAINENAHQ